MHSPPRRDAAASRRAVLRDGPPYPLHPSPSAVPARPAARRRNRTHSRGQSLVEFALALPIILFLTLITLDFGRVYLGWINLQNMARIAANYAANNPDADWNNPSDATVVAYQTQIRADAAASNCTLPKVGGVQTAPTPAFTDADGNGTPGIGDTATVAMTCQFGVITPLVSNVVGSSVAVSASAVFPVKSGMIATGSGGGGGGGFAPTAAFTGNGIVAPSSVSGVAPFTVVFRDTSGGGPTSWLWSFPDDGTTSAQQDPLGHTFQNPGTYLVSMTASNANGSSSQTMGVTVIDPGTVDFTVSPSQTGNAPLALTFTSTSAPGGTAYAWSFGSGEGTGTGATATHTYSTAGTFSVTLTVTYSNGPASTTKTNYITVSPKQCTVPSLNGKKRNQVDNLWSAAGFTGAVSNGPGAPSGQGWTVTTQSVTANSSVPCSASVVVNDH